MFKLKLFYRNFLQVFQPRQSGQEKQTLAADAEFTTSVSDDFVVSFSATAPVLYTLADTFDENKCFRAQDRTIGIKSDVTHITFHATETADLYIERM